MNGPNLKLVVGLGNPGAQYAATRHNAGWLVVDEVARRWNAAWRQDKEALIADVRVGPPPGARVLLVKPLTFMNASGRAVQPLMGFYKLTGEQLLVVQDDLDSPFGLLKFRMGGRHGGQNGVRDIIRLLGHEAFARLKVGISRPPPGWQVPDWVLSRWQPDEQSTLSELVQLGADAVERWAVSGLAEAQGAFNGTDLRPAPPKPVSPELKAEPGDGQTSSEAATNTPEN